MEGDLEGQFVPIMLNQQQKSINQIAVIVWMIVFILLFVILSVYSGFITAHIVKHEGATGLV